ncbi:glutaredoxin family protein [Massilia sp. 9096]|uniref:glutaredoxin family protein n=1 Tax=Massilia sp. 9096 TaxID=1500894 RepID=UPI00068C82EB|nr:glutaredoxin family protein [Massilia sp. 9096]
MRREHRHSSQLYARHDRGHGGAWRTAAALIGLALLVAAGAAAAQAQVYKWKDAKGQLHYGDTPPPQGAQTLQVAGKPAPAPAGSAMPYELTRAVLQHPVTLYTTAGCGACDQGRSLLRARGVPFTEKTVSTQDDQQAQRRQTGKDELPLLLVGTRQVVGFQAAGWQEALDSASYPRQSMLPSGYRFDPPEPAAPPAAAGTPGGPVRARIKAPPDAAQAQAAQPRTQGRAKPAGNAPPDFQF